jgi:hypothetical protein
MVVGTKEISQYIIYIAFETIMFEIETIGG